ncbi:hypothetical protein EVAR_85117_1 [Eumeta japonica]|uniref:Uncharacterized protein n=1 Tax=Eumeta variegata TaxID=151549 RepID=A0A4C1XUH3_EUMVA|nr:hypothetical protein EVAR_85117_1 [Eumeta japonica]
MAHFDIGTSPLSEGSIPSGSKLGPFHARSAPPDRGSSRYIGTPAFRIRYRTVRRPDVRDRSRDAGLSIFGSAQQPRADRDDVRARRREQGFRSTNKRNGRSDNRRRPIKCA